jgi:hypothetical protein
MKDEPEGWAEGAIVLEKGDVYLSYWISSTDDSDPFQEFKIQKSKVNVISLFFIRYLLNVDYQGAIVTYKTIDSME